MRKCSNCYYGHNNIDNKEWYCDEGEIVEVPTNADDTCDEHQFVLGFETEKNYLVYDNDMLIPGYVIINVIDGELKRFLKIYQINNEETSCLAIKAYEKDFSSNKKSIEFTFRNIEDYFGGLYGVFKDLNKALKNKKVKSFDKSNNYFNLKSVGSSIVKLTVSRDMCNVKKDTIDILIGDENYCPYYDELMTFYQALEDLNPKELKSKSLSLK